MTLVVTTPQGVMLRRVPSASPLPEATAPGYAVEEATLDAAARWGLPDFIFSPVQGRVGSGVREVGDGIVIVGSIGAVLQMKTRTAASDDAQKEASWLNKNVAKALRQCRGTIRRLRSQPTEMTNARGRPIPIDGGDYEWLCVVVVEHDELPVGYTAALTPNTTDEVVILRRDWEFLFDHLRSTRAVLSYLKRVGGQPYVLGKEPVRYHELALADLAAEPEPVDPALDTRGTLIRSMPRAPLEPAGSEETQYHLLLRMMMEDIANSPVDESSELNRLWMLGELDSLPVAARTELGEVLFGFMSRLSGWTGDGVRTETRVILPNPGAFAPLVFMIGSSFSELARDALRCRTHLLHYDYMQATGIEDVTTVGVLLTPGTRSGRPWDTTTVAMQGDQGHSEEDIQDLRAYVDGALQPRPNGLGAG
jgi:hypothetical protein